MILVNVTKIRFLNNITIVSMQSFQVEIKILHFGPRVYPRGSYVITHVR